MIDLYTFSTPNGRKISIALEELELSYRTHVVDITKGGAHVSVDALGVAATCRNSINSLRKQGRHLQIGLTTQAEKGEIAVPISRPRAAPTSAPSGTIVTRSRG